ncbi:MAG: pantoate--beta-alanine ligase [Phycisphaerales bacterium]|nr:pantoate--beta-alanine ligase [Phycisphaerales bacterium]
MQVVRTIREARAAVAEARAAGRRVGFVPTMGFLHQGHLSLVAAARQDGCWTAVSIFVNPLQFGPSEDFERYPRDEARDLELLRQAGVDLVFVPTAAEMYPPNAVTRIHVERLTEHLCGPWRPGHFDGVATVVAKLFAIVPADRAYFGRKDAQQLAVIGRMVRDLDLPIEVVGCDTVREPDGLAMSSRNVYLSADERRRATALYRALCLARDQIGAGERDVSRVAAAMRRVIDAASPTQVDYVSVVDAEELQPVERIDRRVLIAVAVRFGGTRLIDNVVVDPPPAGS